MCAWYLLSGSVRLRRCPEVDAVLDELRDLRGDEFEVIATDAGPGAIELTFRGSACRPSAPWAPRATSSSRSTPACWSGTSTPSARGCATSTSPPTRPSTTSWPGCRRVSRRPMTRRHRPTAKRRTAIPATTVTPTVRRPADPARGGRRRRTRSGRSARSRPGSTPTSTAAARPRRRSAGGPVAQAGVRADRRPEDGRQYLSGPMPRPYAYATRSSPRGGTIAWPI